MPKMTQRLKAGCRGRPTKVLVLLACFACGLLVAAGCRRVEMTPPVTYPSVVTSRAGLAFFVRSLRIPGTLQELRLKQGGTLTWVPLKQVSAVRFVKPGRDNYRPAIIFLTDGGRLEGEVFVDFLIEGATDMGYWNMSMLEVERLEMGTH